MPPPSGSQVAQWSDFAQVVPASGALTDVGPITASGNSVTDLEFIGMKGLAIVPSACAAQTTVSLPALSWSSLLLLMTLLMLVAHRQFSRRYPTI